jgi:hypothetical protein
MTSYSQFNIPNYIPTRQRHATSVGKRATQILINHALLPDGALSTEAQLFISNLAHEMTEVLSDDSNTTSRMLTEEIDRVTQNALFDVGDEIAVVIFELGLHNRSVNLSKATTWYEVFVRTMTDYIHAVCETLAVAYADSLRAWTTASESSPLLPAVEAMRLHLAHGLHDAIPERISSTTLEVARWLFTMMPLTSQHHDALTLMEQGMSLTEAAAHAVNSTNERSDENDIPNRSLTPDPPV